eukprot:1008227-Amphidinium_carterae.1
MDMRLDTSVLKDVILDTDQKNVMDFLEAKEMQQLKEEARTESMRSYVLKKQGSKKSKKSTGKVQ